MGSRFDRTVLCMLLLTALSLETSDSNDSSIVVNKTQDEAPEEHDQGVSELCAQAHPSHSLCIDPAEECMSLRRGFFKEEIELILTVHNSLRSQIAVEGFNGFPPAENMRELMWNDKLARIAQGWSDQCSQTGRDCEECRVNLWDPDTKIGQNVDIRGKSFLDIPTTVIGVIQNWASISLPQEEKPVIIEQTVQSQTKSQRQIFEAQTQEIGCGMFFYPCPIGQCLKTVCNYSPGGGYYQYKPRTTDGNFCSDPDLENSATWKGLCVTRREKKSEDIMNLVSGNDIWTPSCPWAVFDRLHSACLPNNPNCVILRRGLSEEERDLLLSTHNNLRSRIALGVETKGINPPPPGKNIHELVWDAELAHIAQKWSEQCQQFGGVTGAGIPEKPYDCANCRKVLSDPDVTVGANVALIGKNHITTNDATVDRIQMFYEEVKVVDGAVDLHPFQLPDKFGHFAQLVWGSTSRIGCGMVIFSCPLYGECMKLTCNYFPAGNYMGEDVYEKRMSEEKACDQPGLIESKKYKGLCVKDEDGMGEETITQVSWEPNPDPDSHGVGSQNELKEYLEFEKQMQDLVQQSGAGKNTLYGHMNMNSLETAQKGYDTPRQALTENRRVFEAPGSQYENGPLSEADFANKQSPMTRGASFQRHSVGSNSLQYVQQGSTQCVIHCKGPHGHTRFAQHYLNRNATERTRNQTRESKGVNFYRECKNGYCEFISAHESEGDESGWLRTQAVKQPTYPQLKDDQYGPGYTAVLASKHQLDLKSRPVPIPERKPVLMQVRSPTTYEVKRPRPDHQHEIHSAQQHFSVQHPIPFRTQHHIPELKPLRTQHHTPERKPFRSQEDPSGVKPFRARDSIPEPEPFRTQESKQDLKPFRNQDDISELDPFRGQNPTSELTAYTKDATMDQEPFRIQNPIWHQQQHRFRIQDSIQEQNPFYIEYDDDPFSVQDRYQKPLNIRHNAQSNSIHEQEPSSSHEQRPHPVRKHEPFESRYAAESKPVPSPAPQHEPTDSIPAPDLQYQGGHVKRGSFYPRTPKPSLDMERDRIKTFQSHRSRKASSPTTDHGPKSKESQRASKPVRNVWTNDTYMHHIPANSQYYNFFQNLIPPDVKHSLQKQGVPLVPAKTIFDWYGRRWFPGGPHHPTGSQAIISDQMNDLFSKIAYPNDINEMTEFLGNTASKHGNTVSFLVQLLSMVLVICYRRGFQTL